MADRPNRILRLERELDEVRGSLAVEELERLAELSEQAQESRDFIVYGRYLEGALRRGGRAKRAEALSEALRWSAALGGEWPEGPPGERCCRAVLRAAAQLMVERGASPEGLVVALREVAEQITDGRLVVLTERLP